MNSVIKTAAALIFLASAGLLSGCADGGTSGTGIKSVEGSVYSSRDNAPVRNADVAILETGDSGSTDISGRFSIATDLPEQSKFTLQVMNSGGSAVVRVDEAPADQSQVTVDVSVDTANHTGEARLIDLSNIEEFDLRTDIVGACAPFFTSSGDFILQTRTLPNGFTCTLRATVHGDGDLTGGVLVGIERQGCAPNSPWRDIADGLTSTRENQGMAFIRFKFTDGPQSCRYRITAPLRDQKGRIAYAALTTLTGKNYK